MLRARGRESVLGRSHFGLGRSGPSRWIAGTAAAVVIALLPSFLALASRTANRVSRRRVVVY